MNDYLYLQQALEFARIRRGFCSPNPAVGAVITDEQGNVIATGYHNGSGTPHAETMAFDTLQTQNKKNRNATLYVTLEPCCHFGKTPPCTDAIIAAQIKRVVFAYYDPNPLVQGKSAAILNAAGIVTDYVPLTAINDFYESYQHWHSTKRPFVTAKLAITLNGAIAGKAGERINITDEYINEYTHLSRKNTDAILTTVKTIVMDDPSLNARYQNEIFPKPIYILDRQLNLPMTATIFTTTKRITLFHEENINTRKQQELLKLGVRCIPVKKSPEGLDLDNILMIIGQDGIHDLWIEAGGKCFASFYEKKLIKRGLIYIAPHWVEGQKAFTKDFEFDKQAKKIIWQQFGKDVLCEIHW